MTDTDNCGWPTAEDTACQHAATEADGRCWQHTGQNPTPGGRPSTLEDHKTEIFEAAREGMTLKGCARIAGVDESTLYRWINKYDKFRKSLKRARAQGELKHLRNINDRGSQFALERSFGWVKTERHEVGIDDDHDISEGVTAEFVTYNGDGDAE